MLVRWRFDCDVAELNSHIAEYQQVITAIPAALLPPQELGTYRYLYPLEPPPLYGGVKSSVYGYQTTCYAAVDSRDDKKCFIRRIHAFRPATPKAGYFIEVWKKQSHPNLVKLKVSHHALDLVVFT